MSATASEEATATGAPLSAEDIISAADAAAAKALEIEWANTLSTFERAHSKIVHTERLY